MSILVVGAGGREHALAWRLAQSPRVDKVFVAPGNGGTFSDGKIENVDISEKDFDKLIEFARVNKIKLAVVGPEQPLVDGLVNAFKSNGIPAFGPSQRAAQLEASKAFSKDFMAKHNIPTAAYQNFTNFDEAVKYVESLSHNVVIKASGLAAGKGVLLPGDKTEAVDALRQIMVDRVFGDAGEEVVVEEFLTGPEISVLALSDGYSSVLLPAAQDHKKIGEGDTGLNTGGMGAYVPTPFSTPALIKTIETTVVKPTLDGMRRSGTPFVGCLFIGLMLTPSGPKVLEYNVRFGDPETEAVMMMLDDETDFLEVLEACVEGRLDSVQVGVRNGCAVTVIAVSEGYPGSYPKGRAITLPANTDAKLFHAGTQRKADGILVTSGGRVLASTAVADTLESALAKAYAALNQVHFDGMYYRRDIAHQALSYANQKQGLTYGQAGVSIDAGNALVERIKPMTRATRRPGCDGELGGFGALFDVKAAGYQDPIIVSATDGVGTKLRIAQTVGKHDTIGQDLVAMCVNDLVVQGAEPLFFLDYYACGKLDVDEAADVVKGIADGCVLANCGLVGGETAEMPGMYKPGDYDLAGFAVGVTERDRILPTDDMKDGDVLIGLASSGIHSNANGAATLGEALLIPTRIYVRPLMPLVKNRLLKGLVHITGGGFQENIPRVLSKNLSATVDVSAWPKPSVFQWLCKAGNVEHYEMLRTFNCGIGMVLVVDPANKDTVLKELSAANESAFVIGTLTNRTKDAVELSNISAGW